ncbi:undecaprenyldiphospho-muramoylpentapeptide beta-N-acetylglucosaminyltransferase [Planctomicrobium sp.]|nr:undecaprenyldiphospho-muramoylpentapeptide beta-N-acetylglucosaminyltransferase [Planctomicrobium sp.]MDB4743325.1 undecaprenyldiphospho-muramoylpentapeptide beta-N-acetylglucosaminyltransferase [Planctomicrobium sp.]
MNQTYSQQSRPDPCFVFCGGGSGGHLFPAIAVCEELQDRLDGRCQFIFLTSGRSIENKVLAGKMYETISIASVTSQELRRQPLRSSLMLLRSFRHARNILKQAKPEVVIGLGGYGSLPGVLAARSSKIPIVLLEQNSVAGKANEFLARFANVICASAPNSFSRQSIQSKIFLTGNPLRRSIREAQRHSAQNSKPTLTILGGSQGATAINNAVLSILQSNSDIFQEWNVKHQTGQTDNSQLMNTYQRANIQAEVVEFFQEMGSVYAETSLVISRAGATTLAELSVLNIPAILVPYPNSMRDHQLKNAEHFAKENSALFVEQSNDQAEFTARLLDKLRSFLTDSAEFNRFNKPVSESNSNRAAEKVVNEILKLIPANRFTTEGSK